MTGFITLLKTIPYDNIVKLSNSFSRARIIVCFSFSVGVQSTFHNDWHTKSSMHEKKMLFIQTASFTQNTDSWIIMRMPQHYFVFLRLCLYAGYYITNGLVLNIRTKEKGGQTKCKREKLSWLVPSVFIYRHSMYIGAVVEEFTTL